MESELQYRTGCARNYMKNEKTVELHQRNGGVRDLGIDYEEGDIVDNLSGSIGRDPASRPFVFSLAETQFRALP